MPERAEDDGDESWTQTSITITPEEDAVIRTITGTTVISAVGDTPLVFGVDQIAERRTMQTNTMRHDFFIDTAELEERISRNEAGCQTFLQGVPKVELPSSIKDEATQTMYLGKINQYTANPFQDITRIMNDRMMPTGEKITEATQTIVTFEPDASRNFIVEQLANGITAKELEENNFTEEAGTTASTCVRDSLYFILDRVLWLSDPGYDVPEVELKDEVAQTCIKYDHGLGKVVLDADTQTSLTCEPKRSNTGLLSEWSATKDFAQEMIDECLEKAVNPRIIVHTILDDVYERCASQIHLPYRDKTVQTLAPCNALQDKDEEVLRKLRLEIVLDPLESSIIVLPLVGILLENTCVEIRERAPIVAAEILDRIEKKSVTIATRLAAIRQEVVSHKPMDDIFNARNKRLKELLRNKTAPRLASSTQTELAGFPEIGKIKEPEETICSTCARHSECYMCDASLDEEHPANERETRNIIREKVLRTQDILIAYNPCYVVTTPSKIKNIQPRVAPIATKQSRPLSRVADPRAFVSSSNSCEPETEQRWFDEVCPPGSRSVRLKGKTKGQVHTPTASSSLNDWAKVVQDSSISGAWSLRGSSSADSATIGLPSTCPSRKFPDMKFARSRCDLSVRSVKALNILKKTFNRNGESCNDCSHDQEKLDIKRRQVEATTTPDQAEDPIEDRRDLRGSGSDVKPYGEGVRIVPVIYLPNQINKE